MHFTISEQCKTGQMLFQSQDHRRFLLCCCCSAFLQYQYSSSQNTLGLFSWYLVCYMHIFCIFKHRSICLIKRKWEVWRYLDRLWKDTATAAVGWWQAISGGRSSFVRNKTGTAAEEVRSRTRAVSWGCPSAGKKENKHFWGVYLQRGN